MQKKRRDINDHITEKSLKRDFNEKSLKNNDHVDLVEKTNWLTDELVRRYTRFGYNAEKWRKAIYKATWRVPTEARIWEIYEASFNPRVKDSLRYFLGACRREYTPNR